jgi:hypothetical protein
MLQKVTTRLTISVVFICDVGAGEERSNREV